MSARVLLWYWGRRGGGALFLKLLAEHLHHTRPDLPLSASLSSGNDMLDEVRPFLGRLDIEGAVGGERAGLVHAIRAIPQWRAGFARTLRELRPDIVIAPMMFAGLGSAVDLVAQAGAHLVYVVHDPVPHAGDKWTTAHRLMQNRVLKRTSRVVAMSDAMGAQLARRKDVAPKLSVQPLEGHYLPMFAPLPARQADGLTRFLVLGRIVDYKGFDRIAGAMARLPVDAPIRVTIMGEGPAADKVKASFAADPRVSVDLRWTDAATRRAALASHDALLCPYTDASQSGIICEALTAGRLTVVTPRGALPEQVGTGAAGRVLADLTPSALAKALTTPLPSHEEVVAACEAQLVATHARLSWGDLIDRLVGGG